MLTTLIDEVKGTGTQKELSEIGRKLLLRGVQTEYGLSEIPEISFGVFGKPYFRSHPDIHFNISHCDKAVVCALSDSVVGIDVESVRPFDREMAEYVSAPEELKSILTSADPAVAFTILWTRKESYCKMTGQGLNTPKEIREILMVNHARFHTTINKAGGYIVTLCQPDFPPARR
ncbi:MAG: 4'-phosphopantetheinyl transferase superfamily protein [Bacteroidales bacterium]|nr:4'-phosphopantetheinyl transferase superfamily protein [Bacteroidales bacterium]